MDRNTSAVTTRAEAIEAALQRAIADTDAALAATAGVSAPSWRAAARAAIALPPDAPQDTLLAERDALRAEVATLREAAGWQRLCKRTEDPKLSWIEERLHAACIATRRNGYSFHAPILEVPAALFEYAQAILAPVDDLPDDAPEWKDDAAQCSCGPDAATDICAGCLVEAAVDIARAALAKVQP